MTVKPERLCGSGAATSQERAWGRRWSRSGGKVMSQLGVCANSGTWGTSRRTFTGS